MNKLVDYDSLDKLAKSLYKLLSDKMEEEINEAESNIPSKTSQLENDSSFVKIYVGTSIEYEIANSAGLIPVGTIVIITDDGDEDIGNEGAGEMIGAAKLGYAKLGELILGKGV